jgi:uncharacterized surface protein with fasciclin (FAS1) repeats
MDGSCDPARHLLPSSSFPPCFAASDRIRLSTEPFGGFTAGGQKVNSRGLPCLTGRTPRGAEYFCSSTNVYEEMNMTIAARVLSVFTLCAAMLGATIVNAEHHEAAEPAARQTIVEIAAGNPDFSTLVAALQAAGLVEALSGEGPFTVFAPTNEAFARLPAGTLDMLLLPENKDKLVAVLTYHVTSGKVMAAEVVTLTEATSLEGGTIAITTSDAGVKVDGANVVATDIEASNGVIHVIDAVILPKA